MNKIILGALISISFFTCTSIAETKTYDKDIELICNNDGSEKSMLCVQYVKNLISTAIDQGKISFLCDEWSKKGHDVNKEQRCIDAKQFESYFNKK